MHHSTLHRRPITPSQGWDPKYPFDLVIAYQDTATRNRAVSLYDYLAQELLDDYDFRCEWWGFSQFDNPQALDKAVDAAAEANMVVLSLRAAPALSGATRQWLETWVARKGNQKSALVTLIAGDPPAPQQQCPLQGYLHSMARSGNMDFFAHRFDVPDNCNPFDPENLQERATLVTPLMQEILDHKFSSQRWGINE